MRHPQILAALLIVTAPVIAGDGNQGKHDFQPVTYCVYELGRLPGLPPGEISIDLKGINNRNQIVGWTALSGTLPLHAFIWDRKQGMRDLGSLPGHPSMAAADINDWGTVVGEATDYESGESLAIIWTARKGVRAPDTSLGGVNSFAHGINRFGQITGVSQTETGAYHAFLRDPNGDVLDLGAFPDGSGNSNGTALNDRGQVIGLREDGQILEAFLWDERHGMRPLIEESMPNLFPFPLDINNRGEVVGEFSGNNSTRAFRWTRRQGLQDMGSLTGVETDYASARSINGWGTIVGASHSTAGVAHGFIWSRQTGMRDLNDMIDPSSQLPAQAVLLVGQAINDFGSIASLGFVPGELSQRPFFLAPRRHSDRPCQ